jgi:ketosteroid isomerase-like protein
MDRFDEEAVRDLARAMYTNDRKVQRKAVDRYYTDDVHFMAEVAESWGKDGIYQGTRGLNFLLGLNGVYEFKDAIFSKEGDKCALWASAAYTHRFGPFSYKYPVPLVVWLKARKETDGKWRIYDHVELHAAYTLYTFVLSKLGMQLFHKVVAPLGATLLGTAGMVADITADVQERVMHVVGQALRDFM